MGLHSIANVLYSKYAIRRRQDRTPRTDGRRASRARRPSRAPASRTRGSPVPDRPARPPRPAAPPPPRPREPFRAPSIDLEELLGGRVLAWPARSPCSSARSSSWRPRSAAAGSTSRRGSSSPTSARQSSSASASTSTSGRAGLRPRSRSCGGDRCAVRVDDRGDDALRPRRSRRSGCSSAGLVGAVATLIAVRWKSREIAAIGIIGALLSPVLVDSGTSDVALAFMAIALVSATGVLLWKKWDWLAVAAFVTSAPQLDRVAGRRYRDSLPLALGVLGCFWVVYVVAAVGFELACRPRSCASRPRASCSPTRS